MVIKVSTLLQHNTSVVDDPSPHLGGPLDTNNFPIINNGNPVTITGNAYPTNTGTSGQVLTTNGFGTLSWSNAGTPTLAATSVGFGDANNLLTGSGNLTWIDSTATLILQLLTSGSGPSGEITLDIDPFTNGYGMHFTGSNIRLTSGNEIILDTQDSIMFVSGNTSYGEVTVGSTGSGFAISSQGPLDLTMINELQINNNAGTLGQVLMSQGAGSPPVWGNSTGTGTVTSVGLTSSAGSIVVNGTSPITTAGTFDIDLSVTGVTAASYGSASAVGAFTVDNKGRLTAASSIPISIVPSQAGLSNVVNSLQVINAGGAPAIQESTGVPSGAATIGTLYVDRSITNGNSLYFYNGATWTPLTQFLKLYAENASIFITPVAAGTNSIALGDGAQTSSAAIDSLAIGNQSLARTQGGVVQASGRFATSGDAQTGRYLLRSNTINAFPTELFIDGTAGSVRLVLPDDSTLTYKVTVTAHRTDIQDGHAGYTVSGVIYRNSGAATTSLQGKPNKTVLAESNPAWDINIGADSTNGSLSITVTGETGKTIRWLALVETVEVTN